LSDEIAGLAVQPEAGMCRLLRLVAEFDRRSGWADQGAISCAAWLSWRCSISPTTAREHVRVAQALERMPRTAALFARGRLSYSKVRAITRSRVLPRSIRAWHREGASLIPQHPPLFPCWR